MRCLALADALREQGAQCTFLCREHPGNLLNLIAKTGHNVLSIGRPQVNFEATLDTKHASWLGTSWADDVDQTKHALGGEAVDWLVVDHYALDARWETSMRLKAKRILVIDDLADRPHDCDLLLDQNLGRNVNDYDGLLPTNTLMLIGPEFSLLRPEFSQWRPFSLARRECTQLQNLLISLGGIDKDNVTGQVLSSLINALLPSKLKITVVMGVHAPWLKQVCEQAKQMPWTTQVLVGVSNMAEVMANNDLAIGAAGGTAWERCALGLPSLILILAENQVKSARALHKIGAAVAMKSVSELPSLISNSEIVILENKALKELSSSAAAVTDGQGCIRTVRKMLEKIHA